MTSRKEKQSVIASSYPAGKVVHDHHHHRDIRKATLIHYGALASAVVVAWVLMAL